MATAPSRPAPSSAHCPVVTATNAPTMAMPTPISAARLVLSILVPTQPRSAGSNVNAPRTIMITPDTDARAMPWTNFRPIRNRPINEMTTVIPAKRTARPLVSIDSTTDSSTLKPSLRPSL